MPDVELELGQLQPSQLFPPITLRQDGSYDARIQPPSTKPADLLLTEYGQSPSKDDDVVGGVPRWKVENLMKMWMGVLKEGLENHPEDQETSTEPMIGQSLNVRPMTKKLARLNSDNALKTGQWVRVQVMSDEDIAFESKDRQSLFQTPELLEHLEDSWKHLWKPQPTVARGLFQWPCSDEKRHGLQLRLAAALGGRMVGGDTLFFGNYLQQDFGLLGCWIAMIGLRLDRLYQWLDQIYMPAVPPFTQIEILIECIWRCNSYTSMSRPEPGPTIWEVLEACYKRKVVAQPNPDTPEGVDTIRKHSRSIRNAIYLVSTLHKHKFPFSESTDIIHWAQGLDMQLPVLEKLMRDDVRYGDENLEKVKDPFFRIDDFNLKDLQNIGHLKLQWTSYWDEHLQLETSSNVNILKIYWFQPRLASSLIKK